MDETPETERYAFSDEEGFFVDMSKTDEDGLGEEMTTDDVLVALNALQQRVDAAERVCKNAAMRRRDLEGEIMGNYDGDMDEALDAWAALACTREASDG